MRKVLTISLALGGAAALLGPSVARACRCLPPPPPREALRQADAVFLGKVLKVATGTDKKTALFSVQRAWKGNVGKLTSVTTNAQSAACGYSFQKGHAYLVYATRAGQRGYSTNICTRTKAKESAAEDLRALGPGRTPGPPAPTGKLNPVGNWSAQSRWKIQLRIREDGTFEKQDDVSPCPPNAPPFCFFRSGFVLNQGTWRIEKARGIQVVLLRYERPDNRMGVTTPRVLRVEGRSLVETLPNGSKLRYSRAGVGGGGVGCGPQVRFCGPAR